MIEIIICSPNKNKVKEIGDILSIFPIKVNSLSDYNLELPIIENGETYFDNALIKAEYIARIMKNKYLLSDDSGLEIEALPGLLGVHSARFMESDPYSIRNQYLANRVKNEDNQNAKFVCVLVLIDPNGIVMKFQGEALGRITTPGGNFSFGYDPIFYSFELNKRFSEVESTEKNLCSHRYHALMKMVDTLKIEGLI